MHGCALFWGPKIVRNEYDGLVTVRRSRPQASKRGKVSVSVLILTLDEEVNIEACLDSLSWCDDVVVFDSLSKDRTREIALAKGARVIELAFDNYAAQRNAALTTVSYKHPWVLMVDA